MAGTNDTSVFTVSVADTSNHYLPDTSAADVEGYDVRTRDRKAVLVVNDQDQDASVTLQGAAFDDPDFADPVDLGGAKTASAGGGSALVSTSEPLAYLRVLVTFATAPTGNSSVTAKFHADNNG